MATETYIPDPISSKKSEGEDKELLSEILEEKVSEPFSAQLETDKEVKRGSAVAEGDIGTSEAATFSKAHSIPKVANDGTSSILEGSEGTTTQDEAERKMAEIEPLEEVKSKDDEQVEIVASKDILKGEEEDKTINVQDIDERGSPLQASEQHESGVEKDEGEQRPEEVNKTVLSSSEIEQQVEGNFKEDETGSEEEKQEAKISETEFKNQDLEVKYRVEDTESEHTKDELKPEDYDTQDNRGSSEAIQPTESEQRVIGTPEEISSKTIGEDEAGNGTEAEELGGAQKTSPENKDERTGDMPNSQISDQILKESSAPLSKSHISLTKEESESTKGILQDVELSYDKEGSPLGKEREDEKLHVDLETQTQKGNVNEEDDEEHFYVTPEQEKSIDASDLALSRNIETSEAINSSGTNKLEAREAENEVSVDTGDYKFEGSESKSPCTTMKENFALVPSSEPQGSSLVSVEEVSSNVKNQNLEGVGEKTTPEPQKVSEQDIQESQSEKNNETVAKLEAEVQSHRTEDRSEMIDENTVSVINSTSEHSEENIGEDKMEDKEEHDGEQKTDSPIMMAQGTTGEKAQLDDKSAEDFDVFSESVTTNDTIVQSEAVSIVKHEDSSTMASQVTETENVDVDNGTVVTEMPDALDGVKEREISDPVTKSTEQDSEGSSTMHRTDICGEERNEVLEAASEPRYENVDELIGEVDEVSEEKSTGLTETTSAEPQRETSSIDFVESLPVCELLMELGKGVHSGTQEPSIEESEKLPIKAVESISDAQSPGVVPKSIDPKVTEEYLVSPTAEYRDEDHLDEENETIPNEISNEEKTENTTEIEQIVEQSSMELRISGEQENITGEGKSVEDSHGHSIADEMITESCPEDMKEENAEQTPIKSEKSKRSDTNTEANALTEEMPPELGQPKEQNVEEIHSEGLQMSSSSDQEEKVTSLYQVPIENFEATHAGENTEIVKIKTAEDLYDDLVASHALCVQQDSVKSIENPVNVISSTSEHSEENISEDKMEDREHSQEEKTAPSRVMTQDDNSEKTPLTDKSTGDFDTTSEDAMKVTPTHTIVQGEAVSNLEHEDSYTSQATEMERADVDKETVATEMPGAAEIGVKELEVSNAVTNSMEQDTDEILTVNRTYIRGEERNEVPEATSEPGYEDVEVFLEGANVLQVNQLTGNLKESDQLQEASSLTLPKEQACLTNTTSEKVEEDITKEYEDLPQESLEHINDTNTEDDECFLDVKTRDIEVSTSEHELVDSLDEVPEEKSTALKETTLVEPQGEISTIDFMKSLLGKVMHFGSHEPSTEENVKLPMKATKSVSDVQSPGVVSEDSTAKEGCLISATAGCRDGHPDEENETISNEISNEEKREHAADIKQIVEHPSIVCLDTILNEEALGRSGEKEDITGEDKAVEDSYQDSVADETISDIGPHQTKKKDVEQAPTKSEKTKWSDTNTEAKTLTEENLEPYGELKPACQSMTDDQISGTEPQPEKSDTATENNIKYQTTESQLEHVSEKDSVHRERDMEEDVTPENQISSRQDHNEKMNDVILTEEIEQMPVEIQKETNEFKEQTVEEDMCSAQLQKTSESYQKEMASETSASNSRPAGNTEMAQVRADSHLELGDLHDAAVLSWESEASPTIEESKSDIKEDSEQPVTIIGEVKTNTVADAPEEERIPAPEYATNLEPQLNLSNIESIDSPSDDQDSIEQRKVVPQSMQEPTGEEGLLISNLTDKEIILEGVTEKRKEASDLEFEKNEKLKEPTFEIQSPEAILETEMKEEHQAVKDTNETLRVEQPSEKVVEEEAEESKSIKDSINEEDSGMQNQPISGPDEVVCQIEESNGSFEAKGSVQATEDLKSRTEDLNLQADTFTITEVPNKDMKQNDEKSINITTSEGLEKMVAEENIQIEDANKKKEILDKVDENTIGTSDLISESNQQHLKEDGAVETRGHGDVLKFEEKTADVFEITSDSAEVVTESDKVPAILGDTLQEASSEMLQDIHDPETTTHVENIEDENENKDKHLVNMPLEENLSASTKEVTWIPNRQTGVSALISEIDDGKQNMGHDEMQNEERQTQPQEPVCKVKIVDSPSDDKITEHREPMHLGSQEPLEENTLLSQNDMKVEDSLIPVSVGKEVLQGEVDINFKEAPIIEVQKHEKVLEFNAQAQNPDAVSNAVFSESKQQQLNTEGTFEFINQENRSAQTKQADESKENEIPNEKEPKQTTLDMEVTKESQLMSAEEGNRGNYTVDKSKEQEYSEETTYEHLEAAKEPSRIKELSDGVAKDVVTDIQEETIGKGNLLEQETEEKTNIMEAPVKLHLKETDDETKHKVMHGEATALTEDENDSEVKFMAYKMGAPVPTDKDVSTSNHEVQSPNLQVPSALDATVEEASNDMERYKTAEAYDTDREMVKEDVNLKSTGDINQITEEISAKKQETLSPAFSENKAKNMDEGREHENQQNKTEYINVSQEQGEPEAKSLNAEAGKAANGSGTEPQYSSVLFKEAKTSDGKDESETKNLTKVLDAAISEESTKGSLQVTESIMEERELTQKREGEQVPKEETGDGKVTADERKEEKDDNETQKMDSSDDAPVMVEESDDMEVKVHKKSHNILSGVGSKVKHSIAKVKKAITGKSSHPKPTSPKQTNEMTI